MSFPTVTVRIRDALRALAATLGLVLVSSTLAELVLWVVLVRRIVRHQRARFELEALPVRT